MLGFAVAAPTPSPEAKSLVARAEFSGTATYYFQGGAAGSCGIYHSGTSLHVSHHLPSDLTPTCILRLALQSSSPPGFLPGFSA